MICSSFCRPCFRLSKRIAQSRGGGGRCQFIDMIFDAEASRRTNRRPMHSPCITPAVGRLRDDGGRSRLRYRVANRLSVRRRGEMDRESNDPRACRGGGKDVCVERRRPNIEAQEKTIPHPKKRVKGGGWGRRRASRRWLARFDETAPPTRPREAKQNAPPDDEKTPVPTNRRFVVVENR